MKEGGCNKKNGEDVERLEINKKETERKEALR
jgi:hypothetical protein